MSHVRRYRKAIQAAHGDKKTIMEINKEFGFRPLKKSMITEEEEIEDGST